MKNTNLSGGELGDGLGALGDGVLGELTGEHKADGGLDLPGGKGGLLVVLGELSGLSGNALEDVVDERVHDGHALLGDSGVGVDLLEDLVDVRGVGLDALLAPLGASFLGCLGGLLAWGLGHFDKSDGEKEKRGGGGEALPRGLGWVSLLTFAGREDSIVNFERGLRFGVVCFCAVAHRRPAHRR